MTRDRYPGLFARICLVTIVSAVGAIPGPHAWAREVASQSSQPLSDPDQPDPSEPASTAILLAYSYHWESQAVSLLSNKRAEIPPVLRTFIPAALPPTPRASSSRSLSLANACVTRGASGYFPTYGSEHSPPK